MRIRFACTRNQLCRLGAAPSGDKRRLRPPPMFKEDFEKFVAVANELVTAHNWHYVCVLVGPAGHQVAGLDWLRPFTNPTHKWRVKKIHLCFAGMSNAAEGVSGVLPESIYFFYKGCWPEMPNSNRFFTPGVHGGNIRDDTWREVPVFQHPGEIDIPYTIKELIYGDVWAALGRQCQEDTVGGKSPEKANPGDTNKKRKRSKPNNSKHRKLGAEREQSARCSSATSGFEACSAITLPIEVQAADGQISEPLCHMDYHMDVWRQISTEWAASGAVLWTFGNGMGALAAIEHEIPTLVFVFNDPHLAIAEYMVDRRLAIDMQANAGKERKNCKLPRRWP